MRINGTSQRPGLVKGLDTPDYYMYVCVIFREFDLLFGSNYFRKLWFGGSDSVEVQGFQHGRCRLKLNSAGQVDL